MCILNEENVKQLSCTYTISLDGDTIDVKAILKYVKESKRKYTLEYSDYYMEADNEHPKKLHNKNDINEKIAGTGVYFILSSNNNLLYVGKSKNIKNRLRQHLISCPQKTNSKINEVAKHLNANGKPYEINYCAINTDNCAYNAIIEGAILDYIIENKKNDPFVENCWNERRD